MATNDQLKALVVSHADGDDSQFYSVAMQVAAKAARSGQSKFAQELRDLVDDLRQKGVTSTRVASVVAVTQPRGELGSLLTVSYPDARLSDLALSDSLGDQLRQVLLEQRQRGELARHGLRPARRLLLIGSPGTGKTSTARVIAGELGLPLFVKPANLGSSVGITKAHNATELDDAINLALRYDDVVVIEEFVSGREVEVAVLGNESPETSVPGEIISGSEFYDYEDKYITGAAQLVIPAPLSDEAVREVRELAAKTFLAMRCAGMARVDFFYEEPGRGWLLNEVNTIPGFTPGSMYPKLWQATGIAYPDLIDRLVTLALEAHRRRAGFSTEH